MSEIEPHDDANSDHQTNGFDKIIGGFKRMGISDEEGAAAQAVLDEDRAEFREQVAKAKAWDKLMEWLEAEKPYMYGTMKLANKFLQEARDE